MKEHFREYSDICNRIKELEAKVYELKLSLYSVTGISYDKLPSESHCNDIVLHKISDIEEVNHEIVQLKIKKEELYQKHLKEIEEVTQERYRTILRCWYLLKMDVSTIESSMGISRQHVYKIKGEAEREFCDKMRQIDTKKE